jgi:hypothetical protein
MKALSLWQPWASWIARGEKTIETRTWPARYRGPLLICAAKKRDPVLNPERFPVGVAVCVVRLVDCRPMTRGDEEKAMCGCDPGRWAWVLKSIRKIEPFPVRGQPGLFDVPDSALPPSVLCLLHDLRASVVKADA